MNFLDKFNWICPLCGKKFHLYHSNSVTPFKNIKSFLTKDNTEIAHQKKPTRIYFMRKDSASSCNNNKETNKEKFLSKREKDNLNFTKDLNDTQILTPYKNILNRNHLNRTNETDYLDNQEKENNENNNITIKMIKITRRDRDKNSNDLRYAHKNKSKNIYLEYENGEIVQKFKNRKKKNFIRCFRK